jgi:hypothetical protein
MGAHKAWAGNPMTNTHSIINFFISKSLIPCQCGTDVHLDNEKLAQTWVAWVEVGSHYKHYPLSGVCWNMPNHQDEWYSAALGSQQTPVMLILPHTPVL